MLVNTTAPIWFYCMQGMHCEAGMVGAVNVVEDSAKSYEAFKALAMGGIAAGSSGSMSAGGSATSSGSAPGQTGASSGAGKVARNAGVALVAVGALVAVLL